MSPGLIEFPLGPNVLRLHVDRLVFAPNTTTQILFGCVDGIPGASVLDLGCGVGPIGIGCALGGATAVTSLDIMPEACDLATRNVALNGVSDTVRVLESDLFGAVRNELFDVIVCDVSGMCERVARLSPWYPASIPTAGPTGAELTVRVLQEAHKHLSEKGCIYFPVISLARRSLILTAAQSQFHARVEKITEKHIPFHETLRRHMDELLEAKEQGLIDFGHRGSRPFWTLEIYRASAGDT